MNWYTRARLDEISVLPPGAIEWYQGAKVTKISELPKLEPRDEVIHHPPAKVSRHYSTPITLRESDPSSWPVGEVVTHVGGGLVRTQSGQVLTAAGRTLQREGHDYVIDQADGSQIIYSPEGYVEALRDGTVGVR